MKEVMKKSISKIINDINNFDKDWPHLIIGNEGMGKSSFAFWICKKVDPSFNIGRIVFSCEEFERCLKKSKPGQAILIDEGSLVLFSRDAMTKEAKYMVKAFTTCRNYNQFIAICIPNIWIIDKYLREHRIRSLTRVVSRGWAWHYDKSRLIQISRDKHNPAITYWPHCNFKDSFPNAAEAYPEEWAEYLKKKKRMSLSGMKPDRKKQRRICTSCGREWSSVQGGKLAMCRCGKRSGKIKGRSCNNIQLSENENGIGNS